MKRYKHLLNAGTMAGLLSFVLFMVLFYLFGETPNGPWSWIGAFFPIILLYLGMKKYKEEEGEGFLKYGEGLRAGLMFTFIYASLSAMLILLYGSLVSDEFMELIKKDSLEALGQTKDFMIEMLGRDAYEQQLEEVKSISVVQISSGDFFGKFIGGLVLTLVYAGILMKKPPIFDNAEEE